LRLMAGSHFSMHAQEPVEARRSVVCAESAAAQTTQSGTTLTPMNAAIVAPGPDDNGIYAHYFSGG
jgi:hypothetical protein